MPPKCSFIQDDCVQIGAWWVELKDLNKVCWTYAKLKGVKKHLRKLQRRTCSRLSLWGLRGLVLSRLMSQWSLTGRSGLAGSPVTPRSPVRRGAPWLLPVGQCRGWDPQSEAGWPGGAKGGREWLCWVPGRGRGQEGRQGRQAQGGAVHQNGRRPLWVTAQKVQARNYWGVKLSSTPFMNQEILLLCLKIEFYRSY